MMSATPKRIMLC